MTNASLILLLIAAVVLIVVVAVGFAVSSAMRNKNSQKLQEKFGPEYDLAMQKEGDQHATESALKEREKRVEKLNIRDLNDGEKTRYRAEWVVIQTDFVDDPSKSVKEADRLITEVMIARGFPVADFEQRAADLSVLYPDFLANYRGAHAIALKNELNETSTEDLRQAMVYFHTLYDQLVGTVEVKQTVIQEKEVVTQ